MQRAKKARGAPCRGPSVISFFPGQQHGIDASHQGQRNHSGLPGADKKGELRTVAKLTLLVPLHQGLLKAMAGEQSGEKALRLPGALVLQEFV